MAMPALDLDEACTHCRREPGWLFPSLLCKRHGRRMRWLLLRS